LLNTQLKSIKDELQDVKESMSFMNSQYEEINKELKESKQSIQELQTKNDKLQPTINDLSFRLNQMEQAARANNIELQCVPEKKNENLVDVVSCLGSIINYKISESDILRCARTAKVNRESSRPRSIVI
jgi:chromosome segregation ATPase